MTLRRQGAMGERETRTQRALVAALRARPRTPYRAVQCVLGAKASIFNSLLSGQRRGFDAHDARLAQEHADLGEQAGIRRHPQAVSAHHAIEALPGGHLQLHRALPGKTAQDRLELGQGVTPQSPTIEQDTDRFETGARHEWLYNEGNELLLGFVLALEPPSHLDQAIFLKNAAVLPVSYTHLRAHETVLDLVCRLL